MKISVPNENNTSASLRAKLQIAKLAVTDEDPDFVIFIDEDAKLSGAIKIDGVDSDLERHAVNYISELTSAEIKLLRAGGIQSDRQIRVAVGPSVEDLRAVEVGLYRAMSATLMGPNPSPAPPLAPSVRTENGFAIPSSIKVDFGAMEVFSAKLADLVAVLKLVAAKDADAWALFEQTAQTKLDVELSKITNDCDTAMTKQDVEIARLQSEVAGLVAQLQEREVTERENTAKLFENVKAASELSFATLARGHQAELAAVRAECDAATQQKITEERSYWTKQFDTMCRQRSMQTSEIGALQLRLARLDNMSWWKRLFYWNEGGSK